MPLENKNAKRVLLTFAQKGARKTSMEDIAKAADISRQSVYKKFGSKEKCYEWAINAYLSDMYSQIFAMLESESLPPEEILIEVFDIFIGQAVQVVQNPHGAEVFKDALKATHTSKEDWPLRYRTRLADFLERHHYASGEKALGIAFCLISAGKGLLLEEPSREQFLIDMKLLIKSICD